MAPQGEPMGRTPSTAGTFRKKFRKNSGKTPETLSERFLEFPSRVRLGCPKSYNSRHLRLPEHFQNYLPPQYGWGRLFFQNWFRRGSLRAAHGIPSSTGGISEPRALSQQPGPGLTARNPFNCTRSCCGFHCRGSRESLTKAQFIGLGRTLRIRFELLISKIRPTALS